MKVSLEVNQQQLCWREILQRTQTAEELGFDGAWMFDHFRPISGDQHGPCLESWTLLAALAASTSRIRLGTLVTGMTYRHPSVLASEAITVDHVSSGRVELGVGAAWFEGEHRQLGLPFPTTKERAERLEEGLELMRLLMTSDDVTYEGTHYQLKSATYHPRPVQKPHPPIWIGAAGERVMLPIVARQADVWHHSGPLDEMRRKSAIVDGLAMDAGRDPSVIGRAGSIRLADSWDEIRRTSQGLREAGFGYLVGVWPPDGLFRVETFARELLPDLQRL